ncbi:unnamed protein product [Closterium sp. NIES-64]|nr:unnamed protein product [Closterium sp. NIES-64]
MARGATDSDRGEEESRAEGIDDQVAERAEEEVAGDDDDDVSDSGDDVVLLGFVQKPSHDWSLERHRFPSKVGGAPAYLDPLNVPSDALLCHFCSQPLRFLLQVYAPVDSEPSAFHRTLFLFACRHLHCLTRHHQEQQQAEVADGRARERRRSNPAATLTFSHDPGHLPSPSSALPIICPPRHLPSPSSALPIICPPHHLPSPSSALPIICPPHHLPSPSSPLPIISPRGSSPFLPLSTRSAHVRVVWHVEGQQALWGVQAGGLLQQGPPARIPSASADAESAGGAGNDVSAADWRVTVLDRGGWKEWEMVVEEEPEEGEEGEEGENREEAGREGGSEGEKGPGAGAGGAEVRRLMREYRERTRAEGPIAASELEGFGDVSCQERTDVRRSCDVGGVGDGVAVCMGWAWSGHGVGMEWAWGGLAHGVGAGADAEKKQWAAFQAVIAKAPEQVIRYCRSATARPLWPQLQGQPPSQAAIPPCGGCGAPRIFEFQVLPQIIYYSAPDATADSALDFATLAVYVCPNSCCRSSPLSTAQQSSVAVPRSVDSGVEATAVGASAEGSSSAAGSRDAGSGDVKGCEVAGQRGGLQEQSMGYVEEFVWVQLPTQDPLVIAQTD